MGNVGGILNLTNGLGKSPRFLMLNFGRKLRMDRSVIRMLMWKNPQNLENYLPCQKIRSTCLILFNVIFIKLIIGCYRLWNSSNPDD